MDQTLSFFSLGRSSFSSFLASFWSYPLSLPPTLPSSLFLGYFSRHMSSLIRLQEGGEFWKDPKVLSFMQFGSSTPLALWCSVWTPTVSCPVGEGVLHGGQREDGTGWALFFTPLFCLFSWNPRVKPPCYRKALIPNSTCTWRQGGLVFSTHE